MLLTPEHEVLVKREGEKELLWIPAIEVKQSDYLAFPIIRTEIDWTDVSKTMMGLIGYYLAEGDMPSENRVRFNFGKHERQLIEDTTQRLIHEGYTFEKRRYYEDAQYREALRLHNEEKLGDRAIAKMLGIPRWTVVNWIYRGKKPFKRSPQPSYERITVYSEQFANFFRQFGDKSENKRIPTWAMLMSREKQAELVKCYWRGDGNINRDSFGMVTVSEALAHQLKSLLLRFGIVASVTIIPPEAHGTSYIDGREIKAKHIAYMLRIGGKSLEAFSALVGVKHPFMEKRKFTYEFCKRFGNYVVYPIKEISRVRYNGEVRNLAVEESQSYVLPTMTVHNCDTDTLLNKDVIGSRTDKNQPVRIDVKKLLKRRIEVVAPV